MRALNTKVIIQPIKEGEKKVGEIIIAGDEGNLERGTVISVGEGNTVAGIHNGTGEDDVIELPFSFQTLNLSEGCEVLYYKNTAEEFSLDNVKYLVVEYQDVCVVTKEIEASEEKIN